MPILSVGDTGLWKANANILIEYKGEANRLHHLFLIPKACLGGICSIATVTQS